MWSFLSRQLKLLNSDADDKKDLNPAKTSEPPKIRRLKFQEMVALMGDVGDLANHDVAFKFWIPEPVNDALTEISERSELSKSEFIRQFLVIHAYGLYAFSVMLDENPKMFKDAKGPLFSIAQSERKRIDTYWVAELGKNVAPIKVWIPSRLRRDMEVLAKHVKLTPSNYVREILISRLFGHGMLPKRPAMFEVFPTANAENWCENHEMQWHQVSEEEFVKYDKEVRRVESTCLGAEED